jgi:DNA-binding response OmpR family regulator
MVQMRLLLVEDSARLRELLGERLRAADYALDVAATAAEFREEAASGRYDLFIVDLGLPDGDGLMLIRELREAGNATAILVITARATIDDRVAGLDGGADDYLVKPFNHSELLARVRALLRRPRAIAEATLQAGNLSYNQATGEVRVNGELLDLRPSERRLIGVLIRTPDRVVPKSEIEETLSGSGREMTTNAVEILISRLRRALEGGCSSANIETVRSIGYMLSVPK